MKILQIASFIGNIGDNASHIGFNNILSKHGVIPNIHSMEMRKFYNNYQGADRLHFDKYFVKFANTFDRVVIGGGGFLDYCIEGSQTGTTINMCPSLLDAFKVPVWFTSLGCVPHFPVPKTNINKLRTFLEACFNNPLITINVRNDSSILKLKQDIGPQYAEKVTEIVDHGFFYEALPTAELPIKNFIAVNISEDQLPMQRSSGRVINPENYYSLLAQTLNELLTSTNKNIVLVPHIYSDLAAISCLLNKMGDFEIRSRVTIAPCIQDITGANFIFNLYQKADLIIGMRLHANVCGLAMAKPTIGLQALDRVGYMYQHLGLTNRTILADQNFAEDLFNLSITALKHPNEYSSTGNLRQLKELTMTHYQSFF